MGVFVVRRLAVSVLILLASSFLMYVLVAISGDPLSDLRTDQSPNRDEKIKARIENLHLDQPVPQRYVTWVSGVAKCAVPPLDCDLGKNVRSQDVSVLIGQAASSTLRLVTVATLTAIVIGVSIGVISALRQYSGFDYTITFSAFLFFSLPIFWVAVLLKQYGAITVNDWLAQPTISVAVAAVLAVISGLIWGALLGGDSRQRTWTVRGIAAAGTFGLLMYFSAVEWFRRPGLGPGLVALLAFGAAFGITELVSGLKRRSVLYSTLVMATIASVGQFVITPFIQDPKWATWGTLFGLALLTVLVGVGVGYLLGGLDRGQAIRAAVMTGLASGAFIVVNVAMQAVPGYFVKVRGRVISTSGSNTPNFDGSFWQNLLDAGFHTILPTLAIMFISFATYSRFCRASMLDTMSQDYVRTARSKGLTERTVVMRHAFRNALIPVTTLAALDFGAIISGAVITENVFGWKGMGALFIGGLLPFPDPNPVMGFFIVAASSVLVFNLCADIAYAYLDPRIRLS